MSIFSIGWNAVFVNEVPGISDVLDRARARWPMYAFSNTNTMHYAQWWSRFGQLFTSFSGVFVSSDIGLRKPEQAAFEHVADAMDTPCERILFFDDSKENVLGAREAGMRAVLVRSVNDVKDALFTAVE